MHTVHIFDAGNKLGLASSLLSHMLPTSFDVIDVLVQLFAGYSYGAYGQRSI